MSSFEQRLEVVVAKVLALAPNEIDETVISEILESYGEGEFDAGWRLGEFDAVEKMAELAGDLKTNIDFKLAEIAPALEEEASDG